MARQIKRYGNRKLYDARARTYVSLEDVAALVRAGETVQVVDNATGEDITAQTLTQVILEEGKRGGSVLPTDLLHGLLRRGGSALDTRLEQLKHGVDGLVQGSLEKVGKVLPAVRRDELEQLRTQVANLEAAVAAVLRERAPGPPPGTTAAGP